MTVPVTHEDRSNNTVQIPAMLSVMPSFRIVAIMRLTFSPKN